jgi:MFS superfamily sulfate permease-like transporter
VGLSIDARDPLPQLWEVVRELGDVSGTTVVLGAVALAILLVLGRVMPRLPAALLVVAAAIGLSWGFDLQAHGIAVVGPIPAGLPSFDLPSPAWQDVVKLVPAAIGIFLVAFADEILTARSFAGKHNQHVAPPRSCSRWAPPTQRPASPRASPSAQVARVRRSTTAWARVAR